VFLTTIIRALARAPGRRSRLVATLAGVTAAFCATAATASAYPLNPITPATGWSAKACCNAGPPGWYEDGFGIIHLEGAVSQTTKAGPQLITTLPPAARPNRNVFVTVHTNFGTYANLAIASNGQVGVISPNPKLGTQDLSFVSLEGITYQPANKLPTTQINLNGGEWSQLAGFGSVVPQWYKDGSGIVHLEGAARQKCLPFCLNSNFVGQLPPAAAPPHLVMTIVHAFSGTWAPLFILPDGRIFTNPSNGADLSFLSLEGVSYYPGPFANDLTGNLNSVNWSAAFGGGPPGWVEDGAGIIHLQGQVTQTSATGANANVILTLPRVIAPSRAIFTIVVTAGGRYADIAILPTGQVVIAAPNRPPAGPLDLAELSLDSITYQTSDTAVPHGLSLTRKGDVLALLRQPRDLRLIVFKLGRHAHMVGTVALGDARAGFSRFAWRLRVGRHRLPAGTYTAELVAAGSSSGPGVVFSVTRDGRVQVISATCSVAAASKGRC